MHRYKCWNIDWDITDENDDSEIGPVDDNGLPITPKDLGLPAWDEKVIVELDDDEVEDVDEYEIADIICNKLSDEYGYLINSFKWEEI